MLTTEQCTRVATEVWRWDKKFDRMCGMEVIGNGVRIFAGEALNKEVNSWEGFGRTVEAMAGNYYNNAYQYNLRVRVSNAILSFLSEELTKEELWEATHLTALEAINEI